MREHDAAIEIEPGHLRELDSDVVVPAQALAERYCNLTFGKNARRDVIQQRLEQMVVAAIEQHDVDRLSAEEAARGQPAEATAHDDDAM